MVSFKDLDYYRNNVLFLNINNALIICQSFYPGTINLNMQFDLVALACISGIDDNLQTHEYNFL